MLHDSQIYIFFSFLFHSNDHRMPKVKVSYFIIDIFFFSICIMQLQIPFISFDDIWYLLMLFRGNKSKNIQTWFSQFETLSNSFHLSDIQRFVFAETNLTRLALLFIRPKTNISSCAALKEALFWKFKQIASLAQMHQIFANCRCQPNEQLFEYFF